MEIFNIIIDRVGKTNVFNLIQGRTPTRETHLQTIVDDDLIHEFLFEIEKLSRISNTIQEEETRTPAVDVSGDLRRIGETFFLQFLPEKIQSRLRAIDRGFLFFHVDSNLRSIPWELLHDGNTFLADRFYMGKNIAGIWQESGRPERERLRVLIVADPTEDLEWARREGEGLFEALNSEVNADRIDVQLMVGRRISKLNLLNALKDRDIIHFAGHMHHNPEDRQESGWLLHGDRILRAREIEKTGFSPYLVFSNSCLSSPLRHETGRTGSYSTGDDIEEGVQQGNRYSDLAAAFLRAGISNYIGTSWEIKDSRRTFDFALNFYRSIFEEKTVGEALFEARSHARMSYPSYDLTWANYALHGNPLARIFRSGNRKTFDASRNILNTKRIVESYPMPIAQGYSRFLRLSESGAAAGECLGELVQLFERCMRVVGAIVFGNYRYLDMRGRLPLAGEEGNFQEWIAAIYESLSSLNSLQLELSAPGLMEALYLHRDNIKKLLNWWEQYSSGAMAEETYDSFAVTYQYLLDNLLSDFSMLRRHRIIYIRPDNQTVLLLHGQSSEPMRLVPVESREPLLQNVIEKNRGRICFFNSTRKVIFPIHEFLSYDPVSGQFPFAPFAPSGETPEQRVSVGNVRKG